MCNLIKTASIKTVKKQILTLFFAAFLSGILMISCSKDDVAPAASYTCLTSKTAPDALAVDDTS